MLQLAASEGLVCPLCQRSEPHTRQARVETFDGAFTTWQCAGCASLFCPGPLLFDHARDWVQPAHLQLALELNWNPEDVARNLARFWRPPGARFLHLGCGVGLTVDLAREVLKWDAIGIEDSGFGFEGGRIFGPCIRQALIDGPLPPGDFDLILVGEALKYCEAPAPVLAALRARLAPGGHCVIELEPGWARPGFQKFAATPEGLAACLRQAGFAGATVAMEAGRIVAICGPPAANPAAPPGFASAYAASLCERMEPGGWLWNAAMGHRIGAHIASGQVGLAQAQLAGLAEVWGRRFDVHPTRPGLIPAPPEEAAALRQAELGYPWNLGRILLDQARLHEGIPTREPLHVLQFYRKAEAIARATLRFCEGLALVSLPVAQTLQEARAGLLRLVHEMVPELAPLVADGTAMPPPPPPPAASTPPPRLTFADRQPELLRFCTKTSRILEIGPCNAPIAPRAAGWNTAILDHLPREKLAEKYRGVAENLDAIEEVDFIWSGGPPEQAIPPAELGRFDTLIASHVIEHIPDFIAFFRSASAILKADGVISLAVPDKRCCFDFFRPPTTTGEVLAAQGSSRHGLKTVYDANAYYAVGNPQALWQKTTPEQLAPRATPGEVQPRLAAFQPAQGGDYEDFHATVFTPGSFELLILELGQLGLIDWRVACNTGNIGSEFIVHLRRGQLDAGLAEARRRQLLIQVVMELGEQAQSLTDGAAGQAPPVEALAQPSDGLVKAWAQRFVLLVHAGNYAEAAALEPLFVDLDLTCAALVNQPSDLLHTLYCLAMQALLGRQDQQSAAAPLARLLVEARQLELRPGTMALGAEFAALAATQLGVTPPALPKDEAVPAAIVAASLPPCRLGIGIITYNRRDQLRLSIEQVLEHTAPPFDLVVADDGSTDGTAEMLRQRDISCVRGPNRGIAWNKNRALYYLLTERNCDVIILLEDDAYPAAAGWEQGWIAAARQWGHVNLFTPLHQAFSRGGAATLADPALLWGMTAQCAAFSAEALREVGYMDTRFGTYGFEHNEHSIRMVRAGRGGIQRDGETLFFAIASDIAFAPSVSNFTAERIAQNGAVFITVQGGPVYCPAWRGEEEMRQFHAEIAGARGDPPSKSAAPRPRRRKAGQFAAR